VQHTGVYERLHARPLMTQSGLGMLAVDGDRIQDDHVHNLFNPEERRVLPKLRYEERLDAPGLLHQM
jgi:hypothetical protein